MLKYEYRIKIEKRIKNTNNFKELIRLYLNPSLYNRINLKVKNKFDSIINRSELSKRITEYLVKNIERK